MEGAVSSAGAGQAEPSEAQAELPQVEHIESAAREVDAQRLPPPVDAGRGILRVCRTRSSIATRRVWPVYVSTASGLGFLPSSRASNGRRSAETTSGSRCLARRV